MPDHIHMLVSIPPKYNVSNFIGYLKGKSALMIFDRHINLKYKYGNIHFWAEGYYVSTVGLNEATVQKYIQEQEKHDIAMDKLSVKEYEDPFRDQGKQCKSRFNGGDEIKTIGLNEVKAGILRRWPVIKPFRFSANHPFYGWL